MKATKPNRNTALGVRFTTEERALLERAAELEQRTVSEYVRASAVIAARKRQALGSRGGHTNDVDTRFG